MSIPKIPTRSLGGTAKGINVGAVGFGAMMMTWITPTITPDDKAFENLKAAADAGATFWNTGEYYGFPPNNEANLQLIGRFFDKYPEYIDKIFISVKGGFLEGGVRTPPTATLENLRRSADNINKHLGGKKKMDLFEMARVDQTRSIEEAMQNMAQLVKEGKFNHIGLSEVSAETIRRANKVFPVAAVEAEYSPWSTDIETNGVLDTCKELGIPIIAYSPLGHGFLTGKYKSVDDLDENDLRRVLLDRFKPENFAQNLKLVDAIHEFASRSTATPKPTPVQVCLAWLLRQGPHIIPIPGSTNAQRTTENVQAAHVQLSDEDDKEIREILNKMTVIGGRYNDHVKSSLAV